MLRIGNMSTPPFTLSIASQQVEERERERDVFASITRHQAVALAPSPRVLSFQLEVLKPTWGPHDAINLYP